MTTLTPIAAARWWADVRVEALNAGIAVRMVNDQTDAILQGIRAAVAGGHVAQRVADLAITEFGFVSGAPRVGSAVAAMLAAFAKFNEGPYTQLFQPYAEGIEQEIARIRGDQARVLNPTPRKQYEEDRRKGLPRATLALLAAAGILAVGVGVSR